MSVLASRAVTVVMCIVVGVALVVGYGAVRSAADRDIGAARVERDVAQRDATRWADSAKRARVVFVRDTIRVIQTERVYRQLRDTLHLTDTVAVALALDAADTTIKACHLAITDCAARADGADSATAAVRRQLHFTEQLIPSRTSRLLTAGKWLLLGTAGGIVASKTILR